MIIPPIIIRVLPWYDSSGDYGGGVLDDGGYFDCPSLGSTYNLPYIMLLDDTKSVGTLPLSADDLNKNLYKDLLGSLLQVRGSIPEPYYSCGFPSFNNWPRSGLISMPFTQVFNNTGQFFAGIKAASASNVCYTYEAPAILHIKSAQVSDFQKQIKLKADTWEYSYNDMYSSCSALMLRTSILGRMLGFTYAPSVVNTTFKYPIWTSPMPVVNSHTSLRPNIHAIGPRYGFGLTFYWIFSMLVLSFLTPIFTQRPVLERADGLVDLSMMMGLSRIAHWLGNLTLDFVIYLFIYILILIVAAASSSWAILAMVRPWVIIACILYSVTSIFTAYLLSFLFRSPRTALIMSYIFALVQFAIAAVFNMLLTPVTQNFPGLLMAWPPLNFFRLTYIGLLAGAYTTHQSQYTPVLRDSMLALIGETILLIGLVFALDRWGPTKLGHRGSTLNLVTDTFLDVLDKIKRKFKCGKYRNSYDGSNLLEEEEDVDMIDSNENEHIFSASSGLKKDPRVEEERRKVISGQTTDSVMVIREVRKVYAEGTKKFTALGGISFSLQEGDCFGLLGPNGAGKSTLVAIMSGILSATSGSVTVAKTRERCAIGLCPQDDLFYADLTVEEHLLFYSRLKGKGRGEDTEAVAAILADVSMQNERRLRASSLSGGQKRRLSVASALCGDPMVVFLDEPSSSLDPGSRIGLWEIIQSVSKSRCTLLTTHSMDEAEVLCNRIGIIKDGHMVCLGSSSQLKNLYGEGYKLELAVNPGVDAVKTILPVVAKVAPDALIVSQKYGHISIQLGKEATLSSVTQLVESQKKNLGINRWSLARNGLDEVFLSIVEDRGAAPAYGSMNNGDEDDEDGTSTMEVV